MFIAFIFLCLSGAEASVYSDLLQKFEDHGVVSLRKEAQFKDLENNKLIELGELLFYDKILSGNKDISCATCHHPSLASADGLPLPLGAGGSGLGPNREPLRSHVVPRNAPAAFNLGYKSFHTTMWDGRISFKNEVLQTPEPALNGEDPKARQLAEVLNSVAAAQAMFPVTSNHEMRGLKTENEIADAKSNLKVWELLTRRLVGPYGISKYKQLFLRAYPRIHRLRDFNFAHVARALAAYEMFAFDAQGSDFDLFLEGDSSALSRKAFRGALVFSEQGKCLSCHNGPHLTDFKFYSSGVPQIGPGKTATENPEIGEDYGLEHLTLNVLDRYKFKTPTLRNVSITGPWSHSGAFKDLKGFIRHHIDCALTMPLFLDHPQDYVSEDSRLNYLSYVDFDFQRNQERIKSHDPLLASIELQENEIDDLYEFLKSLTNKSFQNRAQVPESVPSRLPVD